MASKNGLIELLGEKVQGKDGKDVEVGSLKDNKIVALYFSGHFCPPCRAFTPVLAETYKKLKADGQKFEVVFISSDQDEATFKNYYGQMPWLALPFADRQRKSEVAQRFGVRGIPTLIFFDGEGNKITDSGRAIIGKDPAGEHFPWSDFKDEGEEGCFIQ
jgi:nucleoredoxin